MAYKWFDEVFLLSLFERFGTYPKWLSAKQTAICIKNMECHVVQRGPHPMDGAHLNYSATWQGRPVYLFYSKKNGCGEITFGLTEEEAEKLGREWREQKEKQKEESRNRAKQNPERCQKHITALVRKIEDCTDYLQEAIQDNDQEEIEFYKEEIAETKKELEFWRK